MSPLVAVWFVVGVVALVVGAESLVRGSSRLAARSGLSPVVIGLTVVAFGTSAPELAVSIGAAAGGESEIALGNVIGSNIANVLLVLGLSAVVGGGLVVAQRIVRVDVPIMIVMSALVLVLGLDGRIGRLDGGLFVAILIVYLVWTVRSAVGDQDADEDHDGVADAAALASEYSSALGREKIRGSSLWRDLLYVVGGLALLVVGAQSLVTAATDIARALDISELVIGLTVVAVGTSLPEIATSVVAAARGQRDMAVGNAIGSNLFNILAVLGITGVVSPVIVSSGARGFDLPFMLAVAVACLPIFADGFILRRWQGAVFLSYYVAYLVWLGLDAAEHDLQSAFSSLMLYFAVPLTALTVIVVAYRAIGQRRGGLSAG
ncbi:MAG: calcium/sodium antiporter [Ilumatobacteraceae bacterium]|jgi:cation:H+ antiporter